jgi:hypothetical protein
VGFDDESKGYRIFWPKKWTVTVERNVKFNPDEILNGKILDGNVQFEGERYGYHPEHSIRGHSLYSG